MQIIRHVVLCCIFINLSGCFATTSEVERMRFEQQKLEKELLALHQRQMESHSTLELRVVAIEGRAKSLESTLLSMREKGADNGVDANFLGNELSRLRGEVERLQNEMTTRQPTVRTTPVMSSSGPEEVLEETPDQLFGHARHALSVDAYEESIRLYKAFTKRAEPTDERIPEAHYFAGLSQLKKAKTLSKGPEKDRLTKAAIFSFQKVIDASGHPKMPAALFGIGQCFEQLSLNSDAKIFYEEILSSHASSEYATQAKERLKAL